LNYLLIGVVTLLLAVALWPAIPWSGKADNRIAAIQARGVLRVSTIATPLTMYSAGETMSGLDYELSQAFADYMGVKLKITVRKNIRHLFDDHENNDADVMAAGLVLQLIHI
ncbi:transporter substrate-binding domain-containing protein, partial [Leptospira borgpetersenii serovar Ballum]|nr:transporter substrate-binding domain-containing protein [Leptospira borgpetersenii serovar Ballum]